MSDPSGPGRALMGAAVGERADRLDPEEFARLYQKHWKALWCVAVGVVRERTLAQDVVQQAAVVGLERLETFDPGTSYTAWMMQIVRNIALNEGRKRGRRRAGQLDAERLDGGAEGSTVAGAGVLTGRGQIMPGTEPFDDDLLRALDTLDETARGCLLMRTVLNMPYKEIALALDVPEGTAASHVHRARATLRSALRGADAGMGVRA
jgi:RNA polymerase sigma-70 factor, ECF subfamily